MPVGTGTRWRPNWGSGATPELVSEALKREKDAVHARMGCFARQGRVIAEQTEPGQVLVSRGVVDAVGSEGVAFTRVGSVLLKGVSPPLKGVSQPVPCTRRDDQPDRPSLRRGDRITRCHGFRR